MRSRMKVDGRIAGDLAGLDLEAPRHLAIAAHLVPVEEQRLARLVLQFHDRTGSAMAAAGPVTVVPDWDKLPALIRCCGLRSTIRASIVAASGARNSWLLAGRRDVNSAGPALIWSARGVDPREPTRADVQRAEQRARGPRRDGRRSSRPHGSVGGLGHLADAWRSPSSRRAIRVSPPCCRVAMWRR